MISWQRYLAVISQLLPAGAVGASVLLGSTLTRAGEADQTMPEASSEVPSVSERLGAVREAVYNVVAREGAATRTDPNIQLAWGNRWNNWGWGRRPGWGWGRPAWNNWRNFAPRWNNWNNVWRNW